MTPPTPLFSIITNIFIIEEFLMEFVSEQEILKVQEKVAQVDFSMQVSKMNRV